MPGQGQHRQSADAASEHTVALDPQLALWYVLAPSVDVCLIERERDDVADLELVFVIVEKEMP